MSYEKEGYAFITNQGHEDHLKDRWSKAISVGDNYKLVQFAVTEKQSLIELTESLGFTVKELDVSQTVNEMQQNKEGPFFSGCQDVDQVIEYFNPIEEN